MKIIAVSSFKGGTAKTSTALHVGAALAKFHKKKVLLVDFDAQANLTMGLGMDPDEQDSFAQVLMGNKNVEEVIRKKVSKNLDLIPADTWLERVEFSEALSTDRFSNERLKKILSGLKYDVIIIDTPPSLCWLTESALIAAQYTLICATPEFYSVKGLEKLSFFLNRVEKKHPFKNVGVALSFWNHRGKSNKAFLEVMEELFPKKILKEKIRKDIRVSEAAIFGKPVFETVPKSRAAHDYAAMAKEITKKMM